MMVVEVLGFFGFYLMVVLFGFIAILMFKYRNEIKKWVRDPKCGSTWRPQND